MDGKEEDMRAAKLALARKRLKDHQEKKTVSNQKEDSVETTLLPQEGIIRHAENNNNASVITDNIDNHNCYFSNLNQSQVDPKREMDINITEILISNKRSLEGQVSELEHKLTQLTSAHNIEVNNHNATKQKFNHTQNELKLINDKYLSITENMLLLDNKIKELTSVKTSLSEENNNLKEQLEFTKAMLTTKETENSTLRSHFQQLQNEFEVTKLQLQQLNSGINTFPANNMSDPNSEQNELMLQKINSLEQQLIMTQKEKEQINVHYENYVGELNNQLKSIMLKNEELSKMVQNLTMRESSLIEQIGEMEIRIQNYQVKKEEPFENQPTNQDDKTSINMKDLEEKYTRVQDELHDTTKKYKELKDLYDKSESKVNELQEIVNTHNAHENISISKLTADIASDKVAAQRATEQNKKLKSSMQELEEAFIKMSQDKLTLTEKITAEKYLNRELTIKLAEIEEKSKDMHTKLMAKDEEMIRLQMTYRELEKEYHKLSDETTNVCESQSQLKSNGENIQNTMKLTNELETDSGLSTYNDENDDVKLHESEHLRIPQEDAMLKLQERFMKIMGEVADLSDEKHRLEHIILQLQNETDTICEYVALYQQQRSLLKKRDEERNAQIKLFQVECERLKSQLEELSGILLKFAEDKDLTTYFQVESRQKDMEKVRSLLLNLKSNTLVDPKNSLELSVIYPCNCCSGNLINV